jgi:hypothetical protein
MHSVKRAGIALAALAVLGIAAGAIAAPQPGQWAGELDAGASRIPFKLTIQDGQRGSLLFGAPANCDVPLVFAGEQNGVTLYSMRENLRGGAFCDMQVGGQAQLTPAGNGGFTLDMAAGRRDARYMGILTPVR